MLGLGLPGGVELCPLESGNQEVPVVHDCELDSRISEVGRNIGHPYPLGKPHTARLCAEPARQFLLHPLYLLHPVGPEQRRKDGFGPPGCEELDASVRGESAQPVEIAGRVPLQPLDERTGHMKRDREQAAPLQQVQQGLIHLDHVLLQHVVEVPHRLVEMETEKESRWWRRLVHVAAVALLPPRARRTPFSTSGNRSSRCFRRAASASASPNSWAESLPSP